MQRIGPQSRLLDHGSLDGRSVEGRFLRAIEAQLAEHVGGQPSVSQRLLIARVARVALRLELYDRKLAAGEFTDHDGRVYNALHNALRLGLRELGMKSTAAKPLTLTEHLARRAAEKAAGEHQGGAA